MKRIAAALLIAVTATACMKKAADGTYRVENPLADRKATEKARDNAAKSGDAIDKMSKKLEKGADQLADKAGKGLERAGKKLQEKGKSDAHR